MYIYIFVVLDVDSVVEAIFGACIVRGNFKEEKQT